LFTKNNHEFINFQQTWKVYESWQFRIGETIKLTHQKMGFMTNIERGGETRSD